MISNLSDYNRQSIINDKTGVEGGYVNDPNDAGGETNHGITATLANQYKAQLQSLFSWDGTMRNLSLDMANWLYTTEFWNKLNCDQLMAIHPLLADKMFDIAINSGKTSAVTYLQDYLNCANNQGQTYPDITVDGGMGPGTLRALQSFYGQRGAKGAADLVMMLCCYQGANYRDLTKKKPSQEVFFFGWNERVVRDLGHYGRLLGLS